MKEKPNNYIGGVPTTIRVPEKMLRRIKALSEEVGDSQNGTMMHLIYLGLKVYDSAASINFDSRDSQSSRPR